MPAPSGGRAGRLGKSFHNDVGIAVSRLTDRSTWQRAPYPSGDHRVPDPLPRANAQLVSAAVDPDPSDDSADTGDTRCAKLHLASQKNLHSHAPVFLRYKLAGRKFRSFARRHKKFLQNSDR